MPESLEGVLPDALVSTVAAEIAAAEDAKGEPVTVLVDYEGAPIAVPPGLEVYDVRRALDEAASAALGLNAARLSRAVVALCSRYRPEEDDDGTIADFRASEHAALAEFDKEVAQLRTMIAFYRHENRRAIEAFERLQATVRGEGAT